jgi:hypothetical protein
MLTIFLEAISEKVIDIHQAAYSMFEYATKLEVDDVESLTAKNKAYLISLNSLKIMPIIDQWFLFGSEVVGVEKLAKLYNQTLYQLEFLETSDPLALVILICKQGRFVEALGLCESFDIPVSKVFQSIAEQIYESPSTDYAHCKRSNRNWLALNHLLEKYTDPQLLKLVVSTILDRYPSTALPRWLADKLFVIYVKYRQPTRQIY